MSRSRTDSARLAAARRALLAVWPAAFAVVLLAAPVDAQDPHGPMSLECESCHTQEGWAPLRDPLPFDHTETAGFALENAHELEACGSCHAALVFAHVPTACSDCHEDPHRGELGVDCELCHAPTDWAGSVDALSLHDMSLFPLTGSHLITDCAACHAEAPPFEFASTPIDCVACHLDDYQAAESIDHVAAGFPTACELCHDTVAFDDATLTDGIDFDHDAFFPLIGSHRPLDCQDCHTAGFSGTPTDCFSCHQDDYQATQDPNHVAADFPTMCELCHTPTDWEDADLDHDLVFPLTGAHRSLDCEECHADGFSGTPTDCFACHMADYEGTSDPDHQAAGFPTDCEECHTTQDWGDADLDHDAVFPLTGQHRDLDCQVCHVDGFSGTPTDCFACHMADYEGTSDPDHAAAGFPTDCEACHTTQGWEGADLDHDAFFALTGAHRNLDCESCHADGFAGTPTDCYSCHQADYDGTTDPNHEEAGFPTDCEVCHSTQNWEDADLDHGFFALTGGHNNLDCIECHEDGYVGTPTDCYACHADDYEQTTDPNHEAAGFPTDCELCHTIQTWDGAQFDHDALYFPIYSGSHQGEWSACSDCHVNPNNFGIFECIFCHTQGEMDDEHEDVPGYVFQSTACFDCHPDGEE